MADYDAEQENLFKEIDEDLRQERFAKLWKQYGNHVIAAAAAIVIGVAGLQAWRAWDLAQRSEEGGQFTAALRAADQNKLQDAADAMARLAKTGETGYALLARFNRAGLLARSGDAAGAATAYMEIAGDDGVDQLYRDLARLMATYHEADRGEPVALIERLAPLTSGTNPWRHSAREITALLTNRAGDAQKAAQLFRELADDPSAPSGIRARAAEMAAIVGG